MAYAAVASLLQTIHLTLNYHQHSISPEFRNQIISIHQHSCSLQSFMEGSSDRVYNWEETIREVTVRAEDIIELLLFDSLLKPTVRSTESELEKGKYELRYSLDELEKVKEEIESITRRLKGRERTETGYSSADEVMEIVSRLCGGPSSLEIIAIWGSGGMGKTSLATNAYYQSLTVEHFDVRAWSIVTGEYIQVDVMRNLLRSMKAEFNGTDSDHELVERLSQVLGLRRYLIVVDDVWSFQVLERLKMMLPDYRNGSRLIFTTRSFDLAKSAHHIHEMCLLDEDESWNLLRDRIFKGDPCPFQLESIGKTIARSCGGHPLSIEVVSGILASNQTEALWEDVSYNIKIACEEEGDHKLSAIFYMSYVYLPHHLRPCFLYLGIFPQGRAIYVQGFVKLLVAEGFVNEETTGEEYVEDLVRRRLVSIYSRKSNGRLKIITVHDLIRGMCLRRANIDNFNHHLDRDYHHTPLLETKELIKLCRRVSNSIYYDDHFLGGVYGSTLRTLFLYSKENGKLNLRFWIRTVRLVRILSMLDVNNYDLPSEVFELFHLRYLAFHCDSNIPKAISNLVNLQTLIIHHENFSGVFGKLPEGIWRMPQLRHLYVFSFEFRVKKRLASLESVQTLSRVVDFVCSRDNIKLISNVKKLDLLYTKELRDYELHNLTCLQKLEVLRIIGNYKMSCATLPLTLKELSVGGLQLCWEDMKMVASLPNLEVLKLRNHACVGATWETSEGGFSRLLFLLIEESNLEKWITKSSQFPRLWRLVLRRCWSLLEVPYEMAKIPTFRQIELDETNRSLLGSAQRIQQDRHSWGCDPLVIDVV